MDLRNFIGKSIVWRKWFHIAAARHVMWMCRMSKVISLTMLRQTRGCLLSRPIGVIMSRFFHLFFRYRILYVARCFWHSEHCERERRVHLSRMKKTIDSEQQRQQRRSLSSEVIKISCFGESLNRLQLLAMIREKKGKKENLLTFALFDFIRLRVTLRSLCVLSFFLFHFCTEIWLQTLNFT